MYPWLVGARKRVPVKTVIEVVTYVIAGGIDLPGVLR